MTFPGFPQQQQAPAAFGGFPQQQQAFAGFPQQPAPQQQQQAPAPAGYAPSDPNSFLMGGGIKSAGFPVIGATVTGVIEDLEVQQQRDLDTGQPQVWDDGKPREQLVITLVTDERNPADPLDDGRRRVYAKAQMLQAIRQACRAAGHPEGMAIGGRLAVQYVGDGEAKKRGYNPPKQYAASYAAPDPAAAANSMLMTSPVEAPAQPAQAFGQPQAFAQPQQPQAFGQPGPWADTTPAPQQYAAGGYVGPGAAGIAPQQQPYPLPQGPVAQAPGVAVNGGVDAGQLLGAMQQAPAAPVVPDNLPANVKAALAVLPPEQVAAALAQMGLAPQQAPAA